MKSHFTATVVNGALKLDEPVDLPEESRVRVTLEPLAEPNKRWELALDALSQLCRERPIRSGGLRYSRDELHERR